MDGNIDYLDLIYNFLKKTGKAQSFEEIWNLALKEPAEKAQDGDKDDIIGDLYPQLVLDNRFILTDEGFWGLREFTKFEKIKKQYENVDLFESTEDFTKINNFKNSDISEDLTEKTSPFNSIDEDRSKEMTSEDIDSYEDSKESLADQLGITEEIDWNEVEKSIKENN
ncbi:DNA-directed RNA polymerase subunit delta [Spiroplasma endosymbiont of Amphibalanus improvisus]|uniref:DNA-directed RNA polymerase subunit delta n=1 Tax=Spiroplasma endosymbiont of Amphibalanus improvisus TaxID=3066327 RepID=UPI00313F0865